MALVKRRTLEEKGGASAVYKAVNRAAGEITNRKNARVLSGLGTNGERDVLKNGGAESDQPDKIR